MAVNIISSASGAPLIAWMGHSPSTGVQGFWSQRTWIGGTSEVNAPLVSDNSGNLTITNAKIEVTSTSGGFSKTVTIDPAGFNHPVVVANSAGSSVVLDPQSVTITDSGFTRFDTVNSCQIATAGGSVRINGTKVLGAQQTGPGNSTDSTDVAIRFNNLLTALRTHGLIT